MGLIYTLITAVILSISPSQSVPYSKIEAAFKANNAQSIVDLGKDKLLLNVLGKEGAYSQSQATLVLKDFFTKKPGNQFGFIFRGEESSAGSFAIGNYTSKGEVYRVTIHFKKEGSAYKVESLTIEKN